MGDLASLEFVHPNPGIAFLEGHAGALDPGILLSIGELLVDIFDGDPLVPMGMASSGAADRFTTPVPADLSLSGFRLSALVGLFGSGQIVL